MGLLFESLSRVSEKPMLPPSVKVVALVALSRNTALGVTFIVPRSVPVGYFAAWSQPSALTSGPLLQPHQLSVASTSPTSDPLGSPIARPDAPLVDVLP